MSCPAPKVSGRARDSGGSDQVSPNDLRAGPGIRGGRPGITRGGGICKTRRQSLFRRGPTLRARSRNGGAHISGFRKQFAGCRQLPGDAFRHVAAACFLGPARAQIMGATCLPSGRFRAGGRSCDHREKFPEIRISILRRQFDGSGGVNQGQPGP